VFEFLWVSVGRIVIALFGLISIRLSTVLLSPSEYGIFTILVTIQLFCGLFLVNPVGQYLNRNTHKWYSDGTLFSRLRSYGYWVLVAAVIGSIIAGIWTQNHYSDYLCTIIITLSVFVMVISATWSSTLISILNMLGFRTLSVFWGIISVACSLFFSFVFVSIWNYGVSWFLGQALGMLIASLGAWLSVRRNFNCIVNEEERPFLLKNSLERYLAPLACATGLMWWQISGYRFLIEEHWGLISLSYAAIGFMIASQLWGVLENISIQFFFPYFYKRVSEFNKLESSIAFSDLLNTLGPSYLLISGLMFASGKMIVFLLIDAKFTGVLNFFYVGVGFELCRVLVGTFANAAQVKLNMRVLIPVYALGAVITTFGLLFLMNHGGSLIQAVFILLCSGISNLIFMAIKMNRIVPFSLDIYRWVLSLFILILGALAGVMSIFEPASFHISILYLTLLSIIALVFLLFIHWKNPSISRMLNTRLN
jgi:O-antigen/teichoic acid export membrane protein